MAVKEARYSLTTLRAVGVGLLSNHEGMFFAAMDGAAEEQVIVFVHPTNPMFTASDGLDLCQHWYVCALKPLFLDHFIVNN